MACAVGSAEVEAIVMVDGGSAATRGLAIRDLARQVRAVNALSQAEQHSR
jgi:hypothetical protein